MALQIKARHCTVEDALKSYVETKIDRLSRFYAKIHDIQVIFTNARAIHSCEIEVTAPPMHILGTADDKDPRAAFDKAQKVVERKLQREKTRMIDSKRQPGGAGSRPSSPTTPIDEAVALEEFEDEMGTRVEERDR